MAKESRTAQTIDLTIQLSGDAAQFVRRKVSSGEYASESEVILEGLETLRDLAEERERWEREVLIPIVERMKADPSSAIPIEQVERSIEEAGRQRASLKPASP